MITIDNKQYDLDSLSEDAKSQLASIQFVDSELGPPASQSRSPANRSFSLFQSLASSLTR